MRDAASTSVAATAMSARSVLTRTRGFSARRTAPGGTQSAENAFTVEEGNGSPLALRQYHVYMYICYLATCTYNYIC